MNRFTFMWLLLGNNRVAYIKRLYFCSINRLFCESQESTDSDKHIFQYSSSQRDRVDVYKEELVIIHAIPKKRIYNTLVPLTYKSNLHEMQLPYPLSIRP